MKEYLRKQIPIAVCICTGHLLYGFGMGWTAPITEKLLDPEGNPTPEPITEAQISWTGSIIYVGYIAGPCVSGSLANWKGRKASLLLGSLLTISAYILLALANSMAMIYVGRILTGLGASILFLTDIVYLGEIASKDVRGIFLTSTAIYTTAGILAVYAAGPYVSFSGVSYIGLGISLFNLLAIIFIVPETPMYYLLKGDIKKAGDTLASLGRADEIFSLANEKVESETTSINDYIDIFTIKSNRKAFTICLALNIMMEMSGIVAVTFFITTVFDTANSSIEPYVATIITGVVQFVSTCIAPFFVERTGRKILLLISTFTCSVGLTILGTYFFLYDGVDGEARFGWLPLLCLMLFFGGFELGFGVIPGTLTGEMFKSNARSPGASISGVISWIIGFTIATIFGYINSTTGIAVAFIVFAVSCFTAFLFTLFYVPETKGLTLTEIHKMLER